MASTLRRRLPGHDADAQSGTATEAPAPLEESADKPADKVTVVVHHKPKTRKRMTTGIFLLGSLFGIIAAGLFAKTNDLIEFPEFGALSMDNLLDVLPASFMKDMRDLVVSGPLSLCRSAPRFPRPA